jgi:hypothetical protein
VFLPDLVIRSRRVVTPRAAAIHIRQGKIIGVVAPDDVAAACAIDPDAEIKPTVTPYLGRTLRGRVERTCLREARVYNGATFSPPCGKLLWR